MRNERGGEVWVCRGRTDGAQMNGPGGKQAASSLLGGSAGVHSVCGCVEVRVRYSGYAASDDEWRASCRCEKLPSPSLASRSHRPSISLASPVAPPSISCRVARLLQPAPGERYRPGLRHGAAEGSERAGRMLSASLPWPPSRVMGGKSRYCALDQEPQRGPPSRPAPPKQGLPAAHQL